MKILQITSRIPYPLTDGGALAMYHVTRCLTEYGHTVILAALNTSRHYQNPAVLQNIAKVYDCPINTDIQLWKALYSFFTETIPYNILRFRSQSFANLLTNILSTESPDIIQLEGVYLGLYVDEIRKHSRAPILLRAHNVEYEIWERLATAEKNPLKAFYLRHLAGKGRLFEQQIIQTFDGIIAITERDELQFRNLGFQGKSTVIPAGVDWNAYQLHSVDKKPNSVCFLGSLEWMPNQQGLLWFLEYVWEQIRNAIPEATFWVAGKNPPKQIQDWNQPGVCVLGQVPSAPEFLARHQIMVVPLLAGGGMRLKIIEGMASGLAIVSTEVGAEGVTVESIQLANSPSQFAEFVIKLLQDKKY
ncbi:MAG: glycosyltransferase family 4 protein, partial [Bacteroidia bacterium]|nr:glycosyltransferase family 4 protein [Bacteroidia bacterium]